jgi:hypothetical protein
MRRPIRLTTLVIVTFLAGAACGRADGRPPWRARSLFGPPAPPKPTDKQSRESEMLLSWWVQGWGNTREDAWQRALENARIELPSRLAEHELSLDWRPSRNDIQKLVKESEELPSRDVEEPVGLVHGVRLRIDVTAKDWQYILRQDQQTRAESRMLVLAKMLAGFVAFLGAVAGYLRLEELTKGYYTAWLRLAAIGFVTAVGAGIWWIS